MTTSDSFKTLTAPVRSVRGMTPKLGLIGLVVEDMGASLAFYRRLGFDIPLDSDSEPHVHTALPGGLLFAWDTVATIRSFMPEWTRPTGGHAVGIAFECADVDKTYQELVEAGYRGHKEPWDAFWGQRYACVEDPDGNIVDLFTQL